MPAAQQLLDAVHGLGQVEAFDADAYAGRLALELDDGGPVSLASLAAVDEALRTALLAVDAFSGRCLRIRLDHLLAGDSSVAPPMRKVLAGTVTNYAGDLGLLRERVLSVAVRVDPRGAEATADRVVAAAQQVLDDRAALYERVLEIGRQLAGARIDAARKEARDRYAEEPVRRTWTAALRELEQVVEQPTRIIEGRWAERVARWSGPDEPIEEAPEPTLGELIEPYER
ncbi:MAG TPA: hypothetical protein VM261_17645 [Kofleriaceae bacterium]|nr:hypothetical protein [Kofleriaceae bacterium]